MKYAMTALMTTHLVYYMNQKNFSDGFLNLIIAIILGIILVINDYC